MRVRQILLSVGLLLSSVLAARASLPTLGNIMPRASFAWLATPKTSVRGGHGIFYDVLGTNRITVNKVGYSRDTRLTPSGPR